jgi:hypothetical protein
MSINKNVPGAINLILAHFFLIEQNKAKPILAAVVLFASLISLFYSIKTALKK